MVQMVLLMPVSQSVNINYLVSGRWGQIRNTQAATGGLASEDCHDGWTASGFVFVSSHGLYELNKMADSVDLSIVELFSEQTDMYDEIWLKWMGEMTAMVLDSKIFLTHFEGVKLCFYIKIAFFACVLGCCQTIKRIIQGKMLNEW